MRLFPQYMGFPSGVSYSRGVVTRVGEQGSAFGSRGLLVHSQSMRRCGAVDRILESAPRGVEIVPWQHLGGEPTLDDVQAALSRAREVAPFWIAAVGGGSVLDLAKACAGLYHSGGSPADHHAGFPVETPGLPFLAAPSTAGTGSEATGVSVLIDGTTGKKKAIRSPGMLATRVLLDADLLATCPGRTIADSGMDALTQAVESLLSTGATRFTRMLAGEGCRLIAASLPEVYRDPGAEDAEDLLLGSFMTGIAFSSSRLGVVHGLAHPLGGYFNVSHGRICGVCLPLALELNREAVPERYEELSELLAGDPISRVTELLNDLEVQNPFEGMTLDRAETIVRETLESGSTAHNPKPVTDEDVRWFLGCLFGESVSR
jgi:alcohol dehydrogenase class IV